MTVTFGIKNANYSIDKVKYGYTVKLYNEDIVDEDEILSKSNSLSFITDESNVVVTSTISNAIRGYEYGNAVVNNSEYNLKVSDNDGTTAIVKWSDNFTTDEYVVSGDKWTFGEIFFDDKNIEDISDLKSIVIKIKLQNYSEYPISATLAGLSDIENIDTTGTHSCEYIPAKSTDVPGEGEVELVFTLIDTTLDKSLTGMDIIINIEQTEIPEASETGFDGYIDEATNTFVINQVPTGSGELTIPSQISKSGVVYDVSKVEGVSKAAATNIDNYTTVVFAENIKEIGDYALSFTSNLNTVVLSNSIETLGAAAFIRAYNLKKLSTKNVVNIGTQTFRECAIETIELGECVKELAMGAFYKCTSLKEIRIPSSVTKICDRAFMYSTIKDITFEDITKIEFEQGVFSACNSLTSIDAFEGIEVLPKSFFRLCTGLKDITIPTSVKYVDYYCFAGCTNLTKVGINSQTLYGAAVFFDTPFETNNENKAVQCADDTSKYALVKMSSDLTSTTQIVDYEKITNVVRGVLKINGTGSNVLFDESANATLTEINLPNAEILGDGAFLNCTNVGTNVNLPNLKQIGYIAFGGYPCGVDFELPEGLLFIADQAFAKSRYVNRTTVTIPSTVVQIGGTYYQGPNNETGILGTHVFYDYAVESLTEFVVAEGNQYFVAHEGVLYTKDYKYLVAYPPAKTATSYTMPEGCEDIFQMAFSHAHFIKELTIANTFIVRDNAEEYNNFTVDYPCGLATGVYHYSSLSDVKVKEGNTRYASSDGILYTADKKELVYIAPAKNKWGTITLDDACEKIPTAAFDFYYIDAHCWNGQYIGRGPSVFHIGENIKEISDIALELLNYYVENYTGDYDFSITCDSPYFKVNEETGFLERVEASA